MGRRISPVTERRRARRAARELCKAEGRRVKAWAPQERKRVAGLIAQIRAHGQQQVSQLRAQTSELIKAEREQLTKRIKAARAAARLGKCVDMTAGPQIAMYAYPKKPAHLKRGGQQRMFSSAPIHGGGKLGAAFRVRGELIANEKAALAAVLRHLKHDHGGIVVLEKADGAGGYVDGPYYGIEGDGKTLRELDPLDPHGYEIGRAKRVAGGAFGSGLRGILPSSLPPRRPPSEQTGRENWVESARLRIQGKVYDVGEIHPIEGGRGFQVIDRDGEVLATRAHNSHEWKRGGEVVKVETFGRQRPHNTPKRTPPKAARRARSVELLRAATGPKRRAGTKARKAKGKIKPRKAPKPRASVRPQYAGAGPTVGTRPRMLPSSAPSRPRPAKKKRPAVSRPNRGGAVGIASRPPSAPGKAPPDQFRVQYRGSVKTFKGRTAREKAQADAEFQTSRYAGTAIVSQRIGPGPNGWQVYDRWQGDKHSHKSSSDRASGRL